MDFLFQFVDFMAQIRKSRMLVINICFMLEAQIFLIILVEHVCVCVCLRGFAYLSVVHSFLGQTDSRNAEIWGMMGVMSCL